MSLVGLAKTDLLYGVAEDNEKEILVSVIIAMLPRELRVPASTAYDLACARR